MSDTAKTILSKQGVLLKNHLDGGVGKGAFNQDVADKKFAAWITEKETGEEKEAKTLADKNDAIAKKQFESETNIQEDRATAILARNSALAEETAAASAVVEEVAVEEAPVAEVVAPEAKVEEAPVKEEVKAEEVPVVEAKVEESKEEKAAE